MKTERITWFKSSYSGDYPNCVETSTDLLANGIVPVRDSKDISAEAPVLTFSTNAFTAFVSSVKTGS